MNKYIPHILIVLCAGIGLLSCKKDKNVPSFHTAYFGLTKGRYIIYDVKEIIHDKALNQHDTLYYQLKTVWGDTVVDNEGRIANKYLRYTRNTPSNSWQLKDVWVGLIDGIRAELVEENQRTVKLIFAPTLAKSWDANAYNMLDELNCYYRKIHKDTTIQGNSFDSTVVVEQEEYFTLVDTIRKYEVYAKGVGLVYKYSRDLFYQSPFIEVEKGTELFLTFNSAGFE